MSRTAIICIEDDGIILSSLGEQLQRGFGRQYEIELADSGAEAIALCAELVAQGVEIAVIISDHLMPGMTGDQLLIELHHSYPHTLKILLTGKADVKAIGNLVNAAALYRYVAKPWNETDLLLTVKEALRCYQQQKQLIFQNQKLEKTISLLQATLDATADGILVLDNHNKVINFNQKFIELWDFEDSNLLEQNWEKILNLALEELMQLYSTNLNSPENHLTSNNYDYLELKNGRILECYCQAQQIQAQTIGKVWSFRDVTENKKAQAIIQHQAFHDSLTNLPNRVFFEQQLALNLNQAQQSMTMLAVMFLDLDRFKIINDTLGHAVGDLLLKSVVARIQNCIREKDLVSRWGGDEFTILLPDITCREDASAIALRILEILQPSFDIEGHYLYITSSIGIAVYPDDGENGETLLKNADAALYWVKERGRNDYQHYTLTFNSQAYELLVLENNLHQALEKNELTLYYQPIVEVATGKIIKMESLIRWQHPQLGLVSPNLFIPIAEETGLILAIGEWVLETACIQNKLWQQMGLPPLTIAVNLSARQFRNYNLLETIKQILSKTQLSSRWLELEITETTTMQNTKLAQKILFELDEMGISLSMDDFGTGYSSLSYLKQFPFKTLKIDRSFIQDLSANSKDLAIINAITTLGRGLNLQVVAEGIDSHSLKDLMETLQCEYMQGYFFSPPLTAAEATNLILQNANLKVNGDRVRARFS